VFHDQDTIEAFEIKSQDLALICDTIFVYRFHPAIHHSAK
jgi:hypothetical protein